MKNTGLYLISMSENLNFLEIEKALCALSDYSQKYSSKNPIFQLRLKNCDEIYIEQAIIKISNILRKYSLDNVSFVLNDYMSIAQKEHIYPLLHGVHLGQSDGARNKNLIEEYRKKNFHKILSVTCHNDVNNALYATSMRANYVAFGAFFPTNTKDIKYYANNSVLGKWYDNRPKENYPQTVIIGGIKASNVSDIFYNTCSSINNPKLTAVNIVDYVAVVTAVWNHSSSVQEKIEELFKVF